MYYFAEGTLELSDFDHVHTASPTHVLMVAVGQNKNVSLLAAQQTHRLAASFRFLHDK
jgi:hypothetical protein